MLGQAHTPRRRLLSFAALALAVLVAPAVSGANPSHSVTSLRAQDAAIAAEARSAVLGLYALDERLASAHARLDALHRRAESLAAARAELRLELRIARHSTVVAQQQLARRVRTLYEDGNVEPLEILFGAKSLEDAMTNIDDLTRVSNQGEAAVAQLKAARAQLAVASHDLASREAALAASEREARATATALSAARDRRAGYIATLATQRRLTGQQIAAAVASAHAAQVRTAALVQTAQPATPATEASASAPPPVPVANGRTPAGRTLTVLATGYALGGRTATGIPVGWGVAAVDPSVIPLGTHMTVPGYGEAVAADIGGAVRGATIDLWFPSVARANAWGRRTITIVLH